MKSKFNILILEDDNRHGKELLKLFDEKASTNYSIFLATTLEEFYTHLKKQYFIGMSLDHKVPLNDKEIAKKYDIDVIDKLSMYHPLGYKSIYTAFPAWDTAKAFGGRIGYESKKDISTREWRDKLYQQIEKYKVFSNNNCDIYNDGIETLFFPFVFLINTIMQNFNDTKAYQNLFIFSIEMFWSLFCRIENHKPDVVQEYNTLDKKLHYMKDNLPKAESFFQQELLKVLDEDFLEDMITFNTILEADECDFMSSDECEDFMALLLLKLNFFSAHTFALKLKTRRNYLRQKEVEVEKIENRAFTTKEYITNFDNLPKNSSVLNLVMKDYDGKSYFLDMGEYLSISLSDMGGQIEVCSLIEDKILFPIGV